MMESVIKEVDKWVLLKNRLKTAKREREDKVLEFNLRAAIDDTKFPKVKTDEWPTPCTLIT